MSSLSDTAPAISRSKGARRWARWGRVISGLGPVVLIALVLVLWELTVRSASVPAIVLPAPSTIAATVVENFDVLALNAWATLSEAALAAVLAIVGGSLVAVGITQSALLSRAILPYILFSQVIPKIALAPLLVVWLGIGAPARLALAFAISFFPMVIDVAAGLTSVSEERLRLARALGASRWQVLRYLRVPSAVPFFFTGAKIAVTSAIIGIIVGEFIAADRGLGFLVFDSTNRLQTPLALASALTVSLIGLLFFAVVVVAERLLVRWRECD